MFRTSSPPRAMISGSQWSTTANMSPSGIARLTPILPRQDLDYLQLDIPFLSPLFLRAEILDMRMIAQTGYASGIYP